MGYRVNLFSEKRKAKKVDDKAFDSMVDSTEDEHMALAMAGMIPGPAGITADIADAALYAKERDWRGMGWALLGAIPLLGQVATMKKFSKAARVLSDLKLTRGNSLEHVKNSVISHIGTSGKYKKLGSVKTKHGNFVISVTEESVDVSMRGKDLLKNLHKNVGKKESYKLDDILGSMVNKIPEGIRPAVVVKMVDEKRGITLLQPFYKSSKGTDMPKGSAGMWVPFEGLLPEGHVVKTLKKGVERFSKGKDAIARFQLGPGDMPKGWVIKGFKAPQTPGAIHSSSSGGKSKVGLRIHQEIGKLLKTYLHKPVKVRTDLF